MDFKKWQYYHEERSGGLFIILFEEDNVKVKELVVDPGKGMSFQRHFKRNEIWLVSKGSCVIIAKMIQITRKYST